MTDDHVDPDRAVRHTAADQLDPLRIQLAPVPAAHQRQDRIAAALEGDMKMRHETPASGDPFDHLRPQQVGLDGGYPVPVDTFDGIQLVYQRKKVLAVPPEVPEVDSRQHDLADVPPGRQLPDRGYGLRDGSRTA